MGQCCVGGTAKDEKKEEEERGNHMEKQLGEEFNIMITQEGEGVGEKGFSCLFTYNQLLFTFLLPCDRVEVGEVSSGK